VPRTARQALKELKAAKAVSPRSTITHVNIGAALRGMGRLKEAREFFKKAVGLGPDLFEAQYNHGLQLFSDNDLEGALAHFQRAASIKPEDPYSRNAMGNVMLRLGRSEEALEHFLGAAERKGDFAEAWNGAGEVLLAQERMQEAETAPLFPMPQPRSARELAELRTRPILTLDALQLSAEDLVRNERPSRTISLDKGATRGWRIRNGKRVFEIPEPEEEVVVLRPQ